MVKPLPLKLYSSLAARSDGRMRRRLAREARGRADLGDRIDEMMGQATAPRPQGALVWVHVGRPERLARIPETLARLAGAVPHARFLVTSPPPPAGPIASVSLPDGMRHQLVPLDTLACTGRFLDHWEPDMLIWVGGQLRPALLSAAHARGLSMAVVDGGADIGIADGLPHLPNLRHAVLDLFGWLLVGDAGAAREFRRAGVDPGKIETIGFLEEGTPPPTCNEWERSGLAEVLAGRPVWLAAGTETGEETALAEAHEIALRSAHRLLLIVVPKHPDHGGELATWLAGRGFTVALRSRDEEPDADTQIYVADTTGELGLWYRLSPITFIGGTFTEGATETPFEPAALGSAIVHGPRVGTYGETLSRFAAVNAALPVHSAVSLARAIERLLAPDKAAELAHAAWQMTTRGAEASDRLAELVDGVVGRRATL